MEATSVFISGSSGYIGSHFTKFFAKKGLRVFGLDRVASPPAVQSYLQDFLHTDLKNETLVKTFVKKHGIHHVIHCAALCLVGESVEKPDLYEENNVKSSDIFLRALLSCGLQSFIFSSTAAPMANQSFLRSLKIILKIQLIPMAKPS